MLYRSAARILEALMLTVMLVTLYPTSFVYFASCLNCENGVRLIWATSVEQALQQAALDPPDLVIVDDQSDGVTGPDFVRRLVLLNPRINTAVATTLPPNQFEMAYRGLGAMGQLPLRPGRAEAQDLLHRLPKAARL